VRAVIRWLRANYQRESTQQAVAKDFKATFEAKEAGRVLEDLRRFCMIYDTTHVSGDSHATAINEGKRQVYLHLVNMLEVRPEEIQTKKKEERDARDDERPISQDG
jgi:uncharacterized protein YdbL (DUF1318 family)